MNEHNNPIQSGSAIPRVIAFSLLLTVIACAFFTPAMAAGGPQTGDPEISGPYEFDIPPFGCILLDPMTLILMELHKLFPWLF